MKKSFCDLCEQPADELLQKPLLRNVGKKYRATKTSPNDIAVVDGFYQCQVEVRVSFGFRDHPTGFGGPPDLCRSCQTELMIDFANMFREKK